MTSMNAQHVGKSGKDISSLFSYSGYYCRVLSRLEYSLDYWRFLYRVGSTFMGKALIMTCLQYIYGKDTVHKAK